MPEALVEGLRAGQRRGWLGPGAIDDAVRHAAGFFAAIDPQSGWRCVDLGSGAGLPGLVLAWAYPETIWTLIDAWEARVAHLRRVIEALSWGPRVAAVHARAEEVGRGLHRDNTDVVVARAFGPPAWTAECAAPLLREGGLLVVSERRDDTAWPAGVPQLGLRLDCRWEVAPGAYRAYRRDGPVDDRFPRRPAAQRRRPLF